MINTFKWIKLLWHELYGRYFADDIFECISLNKTHGPFWRHKAAII